MNMEKKENAAAHHTLDFQTTKLVLRRGQLFNMKVILNRPLHPQDELKLTFFVRGEASAPEAGWRGGTTRLMNVQWSRVILLPKP